MSLNVSSELMFDKVCRTCLTTLNLRPLYNEEFLDRILKICTSIECKADDGLPMNICTVCISELKRFYIFGFKCRETDAKLRKRALETQLFCSNVSVEPKKNTLKDSEIESLHTMVNSLKDPLDVSEIKRELNDDVDVIKNEIDIEIKTEPCDVTTALFETVKVENARCTEYLEVEEPVLLDSNQDHQLQINKCNSHIMSEDQIDYDSVIDSTEIIAGEKPYSASISSKSMDCIRRLRLRTQHSCTVCGKTFNQAGSLKNHIVRTHAPMKSYCCIICGSSFHNKPNFIDHMRTHTGEKLFSCFHCDRSFSRKGYLKVHMRTHTGDKPYSCMVCHKVFARSNALTGHMQVHALADKDLYSCELCEQTFNQKKMLDLHMLTHTSEPQYECKVCGKMFKRVFGLNYHMRLHTGRDILHLVANLS